MRFLVRKNGDLQCTIPVRLRQKRDECARHRRWQDSLGLGERFLHVHDAMPDLIQCGLIHEPFEAIYLVLDGNGCVGRLLIPLFLTERGRLSQPLT